MSASDEDRLQVPTIHLIEDDADQRMLLETVLSEHFEIVCFHCGETALEAWKLAPPDLILLDINLPGIDGFSVLEQVRQDPLLANVPVVALSAMVSEPEKQRIRSAGFACHIPKPILDFGLLQRTVSDLLP